MITHEAPGPKTRAVAGVSAALACVALVQGLGLAFGCGLQDGARFGHPGARAGLLRVHLREPVVELDPARARTPLERALARQLFSALVEVVDGRAVPSLAASWAHIGDGRLLVRLREDARFSDGAPLTAHDVVWSWRRALRPSTGAADLRWSATIGNGAALARGTLLRVTSDVSARGAPYAVFRDQTAVDDVTHAVFAAGTAVRVLDSNARTAGANAAGIVGPVPLGKSPDDTATSGAALVPGEVATVIGLVEIKGRVMLQVRAAGAAGWAPADALAIHVPAISVVPVVHRGGPPPELRAGPEPGAQLRATLSDEAAVEVLERGAQHSLVVDVASGTTGFIDSAFLEETLRERRWFLVEPVSGAAGSDAAARGWVSEQDLVFDAGLLDVRARDAHTLEVGLTVDVDRALLAFADPVFRPVPRRAVEERGRAWTAHPLVTSGPFSLVTHDPRGGLVLARSPSSFEAPRALLEHVELVHLQRATTALHLYRAGLLDALVDGALPQELAGTLSRATDWRPGAAGGALIAPEVQGLDGSNLELRDVVVVDARGRDGAP